MHGLAIVSEGIEDISVMEIGELIGAKASASRGCVIFSPKNIKDLCALVYSGQSFDKLLYLLGYSEFGENNLYEKIKTIIENTDLGLWLGKKSTFKASCRNLTNLSSEEICANTGEIIIDEVKKKLKYTQKVDLNSPDVIFFVYLIGNMAYIGIDITGFEHQKRHYKIFSHPASLRGTIAYALLRISGYKAKQLLLDPFAGSGMIPIEAALHAYKFPLHYYSKDRFSFIKLKPFSKIDSQKLFSSIDKKILKPSKTLIKGSDSQLRCVTASSKNAKIAGIDKYADFSRIDIEWLDTKFEESSIDMIVTHPPMPSSNIDPKSIEKLYKEFFYQAEFVLKKKGKIAIISNSTDMLKKAAEMHKFKIAHERTVFHGMQKLEIIVFEK